MIILVEDLNNRLVGPVGPNIKQFDLQYSGYFNFLNVFL